MKVALVYDRVNKWGGAERVLLALHKLFPDAPLYTSVYDRKKALWADVFNVKTSFLQSFPFAMHHELYALLMPIAFESFNFDEYDLVISVTSEAAKGIITKPKTRHICYCLTPTRYLWSGYDDYFKAPILKLLSKPVVAYLKIWDKVAAQRPDAYIAISKEVQSRISKYYGRESEVVCPPVELARGTVVPSSHPMSSVANSLRALDGTPSSRATPRPILQDYFLIVSRLVPYKKIDIAIRAFNKLKLPLKIVGIGSDERRLKRMSCDNIELLGHLTDKELVEYYKGCRALVFPGLEDFGLAVIEVQSFGKPVIAFRGGGALESVVENKTGVFFDKQTEEDLMQKVTDFRNIKFDPKECIENARKYSLENFKKTFLSEIKKLISMN